MECENSSFVHFELITEISSFYTVLAENANGFFCTNVLLGVISPLFVSPCRVVELMRLWCVRGMG